MSDFGADSCWNFFFFLVILIIEIKIELKKLTLYSQLDLHTSSGGGIIRKGKLKASQLVELLSENLALTITKYS